MSEVETVRVTPLREHMAEELRALLARRKMSATQLARHMGISQAYIWRRLSGETAFDVDDLEKIAVVLGVDVAELLPRPSVGRTVVVSGSPGRQTTGPYLAQAKRPHPIGHRRRPPNIRSGRRPPTKVQAVA